MICVAAPVAENLPTTFSDRIAFLRNNQAKAGECGADTVAAVNILWVWLYYAWTCVVGVVIGM